MCLTLRQSASLVAAAMLEFETYFDTVACVWGSLESTINNNRVAITIPIFRPKSAMRVFVLAPSNVHHRKETNFLVGALAATIRYLFNSSLCSLLHYYVFRLRHLNKVYWLGSAAGGSDGRFVRFYIVVRNGRTTQSNACSRAPA